MSTLLLVVLAIITAIASVLALFFIRWREQQRLEKARAAINLSDDIGDLSVIADALQPWLSLLAKRFIGTEMHRRGVQLQQLDFPVSRKIQGALLQAEQWRNEPAASDKQELPVSPHQAQHLRQCLQSLMNHVRHSYQQHRIPKKQANDLLREIRVLNVRISVHVFSDKATAFLHLNNTTRAQHFINKASKSAATLDDIPDDLSKQLERLTLRLNEVKAAQAPATPMESRLEKATEQMAADEDSWKKKHY